ncbi:MAG: hypothetical protein ACR2RD_04065 [Woeseiaceae bacterium]
MTVPTKTFLLKMSPLLLLVAITAVWFADVERGQPYLLRNLLPLLLLLVLAGLTLYRGGGTWLRAGWRMPLGTLGFAIPALCLSAYLHYAYSVNLNDMFDDALYPGRVFRYLPIYTLVAGAIGFAIGWIAGRNV